MPGSGHDHHGDRRTFRHYARDFIANWEESEASLGRRLWLTVRNRSRAFAPPFRGCCGRPGEPGC